MSSNDPAELHNIPAAKPPPGVTPNHAHPAGDGPVAIGIGSLMLALMLIFASVRIYTKAKIVKRFSADDCGYCTVLELWCQAKSHRYLCRRSCKSSLALHFARNTKYSSLARSAITV